MANKLRNGSMPGMKTTLADCVRHTLHQSYIHINCWWEGSDGNLFALMLKWWIMLCENVKQKRPMCLCILFFHFLESSTYIAVWCLWNANERTRIVSNQSNSWTPLERSHVWHRRMNVTRINCVSHMNAQHKISDNHRQCTPHIQLTAMRAH